MRRMLAMLAAALMVSPTGARGTGATFDWVAYEGRDPVEAAMPLRPGQYRNPVIPGFHPDPSIVRVGRDYYLVNSSFAFYPGLPIFHSRDLVNWRQIGNAIDRPDMFDFNGLGVARAIFAPTIRHHAGRFYIINTCIECGFNFIISARDPRGPWSKPVFLPAVDGIDPDLFFDDDGRAWVANNGPPVGTPLYDGHRAIWIQELDLKAMAMVGARTMIVDGGVDIRSKPIWTEGPHIIKRDGWYYLIAAEGGTAGDHSQTVYRSRAVTGPYQPGPVNPILTQRDLDPARPFPVQATGHADFVQTPDGDWWAVFLGTRPYERNLSNLGRETFLLPAHWPREGWPLILPAGAVVPQAADAPRFAPPQRRNWSRWREDFVTPGLTPDWVMLRTPKSRWWAVARGALTLTPQRAGLDGSGNPSFLAKRQQHSHAVMTTALRFAPGARGDFAGLAAFADERHHFALGIIGTGKSAEIVVLRRDGDGAAQTLAAAPLAASPSAPVRLRIAMRGARCDFAYAVGSGGWRTLLADADARILASEPTNQFTGTVIGPYAVTGPR